MAGEVVRLLRSRAKEPPSVADINECVREVTKQTASPALPEETSGEYLPPEEIAKRAAEFRRAHGGGGLMADTLEKLA